MNKSQLSEEDIKARYITPAVTNAGWDLEQIRFEYAFTAGRIIVQGNITTRGNRKRADYVLFYKSNLPLAIIEAKDNNHSVGAGLQQAIDYANALDIPYVYSSNGDAFVGQNLITGEVTNISLNKFPSPDELYNKFKRDKQLTKVEEEVMMEPYYYIPGYKEPRYYQRNAINRVVNAVAGGQERVLLVSATGTGKTFMAFQIIHRLWKSGQKKRILFLADRNVLIDQTMTGDFRPFEGSMTKVQNRNLDSSYEIYMALYQQLVGDEGEEIFREFQPSFFDLIVIDECHRGSAREESAWRKILDYFVDATHVGLTATPIETKEASSVTYFGEPIYEYSLKQGIDDGFLAPYKVIRIGLDKDLEGYRPVSGKVDKFGHEIEDREYNVKDFDRNIVIDDRTKVVAKKVTEFLKNTDRFSKTIVFCVDVEHAERMRQALINENKDLYREDNRYIMRITGDNDEGKAQLENFIDEDSTYPVIAVTSKLMTTGVDAKMCKLIVLENNINSMTEFKQIIGRGTRLLEDYGKTYFTIMDFRNVSRHFADPAFDGNPEVVMEITEDDPVVDPVDVTEGGYETDPTGGNTIIHHPPFGGDGDDPEDEYKPKKYYLDDVEVKVISERVQYLDSDGKLITESLIDYTKKNIVKQYAKLDEFLKTWTEAEKKRAIIDELETNGVFLEAVREETGQQDLDDFDLICHLAYDKPPLTKKERVENVKKRHYLYQYSDVAQKVIEALLDKYADDGIREIEDRRVLQLKEFAQIGSPLTIVKEFGGIQGYEDAIKELTDELYSA
jgi:type I restriction enzyme R subunit